MWFRNVFFVAVLGAAAAGFTASLVPARKEPREQRLQLPAAAHEGFESLVRGVDEAFAADWSRRNLQPADPAPDLTVARRLSLALTGTTPSLEEIRRFELQPPESRLDWWAAGILNDQRFYDYLAERLARAYVGTADGPAFIYRRRRFVTWLADELQANRPYDRIVRELISQEGLATNEPATNFIVVTIKSDQDKGPDESALAARVSRAFLGLRLDCAECHDHPFDQWKQSQFRELAAFFSKTDQTLTGIREGKGAFEIEDRTTGERRAILPKVPFQPELLPEAGKPRQRLAAWVTHRENRHFSLAAVNRVWALMLGRALVEPVDNIKFENVSDLPPALTILADDFAAHGHNLRRLILAIAATHVFRLDSRAPLGDDDQPLVGRELTPEHDDAWAAFPMTRLRSEQVVGALLQSSRLSTIDSDSHILVKLARNAGQQDFVERYGDAGEDELEQHGGTIPQRLLMMNGKIVRERVDDNFLGTAASQISLLAPTDDKAVETAYLAVLARRPTPPEAALFAERLRGKRGNERTRALQDLYWDLLNCTEFSWNH